MREEYGKTSDGIVVNQYTISNRNGMKAVLIDYGAILNRLYVPDKQGNLKDIVLGCPDAVAYESNSNAFGSTIGPNANRIAGAQVEIDGVTYNLDKNDGENNLHTSLPRGLNKRHWDATYTEDSVTFYLAMTDGDLGLPGNRKFKVTYTITEDNELKIHYHATSDKNTIFNLTNHSYFNLAGHESGEIYEQTVQIDADTFTKVREGAIPTGEIEQVKGTPLDYTVAKPVGQDIGADNDQMKLVAGYDFNYCINNYDGSIRKCATACDPQSGRKMEVYTTLPGVHFYTGNFISHAAGKDGMTYERRYGMCFETQYYPDSIHHDNFPDVVFGPDREYNSTTIFKFL